MVKGPKRPKFKCQILGCGSKLQRRGYAGFGPCFHLPGYQGSILVLFFEPQSLPSQSWDNSPASTPLPGTLCAAYSRSNRKCPVDFHGKERAPSFCWLSLKGNLSPKNEKRLSLKGILAPPKKKKGTTGQQRNPKTCEPSSTEGRCGGTKLGRVATRGSRYPAGATWDPSDQ